VTFSYNSVLIATNTKQNVTWKYYNGKAR
jgi:hypothetical protein